MFRANTGALVVKFLGFQVHYIKVSACAWMGLALVFAVHSRGSATPVEASDPKIIQKAEGNILRSVIHMKTSVVDCSAALVSKNILLTARHCTASDPGTTLQTGSTLELNGQKGFVIRDIIRYGQMFSGPRGSQNLQISTDLALILVVPPRGQTSILEELPVLPIATPEVASTLDQKILVSGYGIENWYSYESKTLRAGWAQALDRIEDTKSSLLKRNPELLPEIEQAQGQFYIAGRRTEISLLRAKKGAPVILANFARQTASDENPMILPGDSGSPAIAFDSKRQPYLIGIASRTMPNAMHSAINITIFRKESRIHSQTGFEVPMRVDSMKLFDQFSSDPEIVKAIQNSLLRDGLIDSTHRAKRPLTVALSMQRLAVGIYTSTTHQLNQQFLQNNLPILETERDAGEPTK
jgi:hypothetical protein